MLTKHQAGIVLLLIALVWAGCAPPAEREMRPEAEGMAWRSHDMSRPRPPVLEPAVEVPSLPPPPGAVVLFDGTNLDQWVQPDGQAAAWRVANGYFEVAPGTGPIETREGFGDVQLHIEWASPPLEQTGQDRGNSGVFLMGLYEIQVLDSYESETYADGQAGSIYGQFPPRFNVTRPPAEWQTYDIFFRRPRFAGDGTLTEPARLTVVHNGVLIQNNEQLYGPTQWLRYTPFEPHEEALPISLQDHGSPVRFRNVWALPIPELPDPEPTYASISRADVPAGDLDRYAGVYDRPGSDAPITITREGNSLHADFYWRPGTLEMVPVSEREFQLTETDGRVVFDVDEEGAVTGLVFHLGGVEMPAHRAQ
jgi:hypothetical protein